MFEFDPVLEEMVCGDLSCTHGIISGLRADTPGPQPSTSFAHPVLYPDIPPDPEYSQCRKFPELNADPFLCEEPKPLTMYGQHEDVKHEERIIHPNVFSGDVEPETQKMECGDPCFTSRDSLYELWFNTLGDLTPRFMNRPVLKPDIPPKPEEQYVSRECCEFDAQAAAGGDQPAPLNPNEHVAAVKIPKEVHLSQRPLGALNEEVPPKISTPSVSAAPPCTSSSRKVKLESQRETHRASVKKRSNTLMKEQRHFVETKFTAQGSVAVNEAQRGKKKRKSKVPSTAQVAPQMLQ